MSILSDLWSLFAPARCAVCGDRLLEGEHAVCTVCRMSAPRTGFASEEENPVWLHCRNFLPVQHASAFLFFRHGSGWRDLIHSFKYHGRWSLARSMGAWYGRELHAGGLYRDVDVVIPIPLHPWKRCLRGYNQSEYLAEGIASELGIRVDRTHLKRRRNTRSQALRSRRERAANVEGAFRVKHPEQLAGRHILLVDDVFTTGSTMLAAASALLDAVPDCRISIAALAVSRREIGLRD